MDLHIHSSYSDGSDSVNEILEAAVERSLEVISITDHDCIHPELFSIPLYKNVRVLPGIEISAIDFHTGKSVHILGYGFNEEAFHIQKLCQPILKNRYETSLYQIKQLQMAGYEISFEEVVEKAKHSTTIYKQHILDVMMDKKYLSELYPPLYRQLFKNGGICDKACSVPDISEAIKAIHKDGGISVLAHPASSHCFDEIERYISYGLDGIETYHSSHTAADIQRAHTIALKYKLMETGGSDYHGRYGVEPDIGSSELPEKEKENLSWLIKE